MKYPEISIIIDTHPPKFEYLNKSLKALTTQSFSKFEVIVVNDGIDKNTENIISNYSKSLSINYNSRPNDKSMVKSRNIGAKLSNSEILVFINSDIVLNPYALEEYYKQLKGTKYVSVWGKYGEVEQDIPEIIEHIHINDKRNVFQNSKYKKFLEENQKTLLFYNKHYTETWGGNFGISKNFYFESGGLNENFVGYGYEDFEFGYRLYKFDNSVFIFSEKAWGRHLPHERTTDKSDFYKSELRRQNMQSFQNLFKSVYEEYLKLPEDQVMKEWEKMIDILGNKEEFYKYIARFLTNKGKKNEARLYYYNNYYLKKLKS